MKGSIRQRSRGSWEIAIDIGRDPSTGKRLQHWETVRGTKRDAQQRLAELLVTIEQGNYIKPKRLCLAEYLQHWLDGYVKTNCSPRTLDSYQSIVSRHLIPNLGHLPLTQIQPQHIQEYYARSLAGGRVDGKGALSARSVLHIHRVLFQALNYAVRQGLLIRNVADLVDPPRARKTRMKTLIPQEVSRLLNATQDTVYYPIIYTAVNTGLRQAELLGLRWHDLDLDLATLSVTQVLYKRRGTCQFKEPKSAHSRRRLDLSPSLALFLRQYRNRREAEYLLLGKPLREDDLVFSNANGSPMDPGTLTHNFARIARRAGLSGTRFHDLRHTFASLMLLAGIHPKIVSEMLGHSSVAFTLDTYSHVIGGLQQAAVRRLDEVLQPEIKRSQDVGKMLATDSDLDTASGQIRTDDRRFTKPLLYL
jgi:integrase